MYVCVSGGGGKEVLVFGKFCVRTKRMTLNRVALLVFNSFLAYVPILQPLKTPENLWFSDGWFKTRTLGRNGLNEAHILLSKYASWDSLYELKILRL